jgi:hypothetical protein
MLFRTAPSYGNAAMANRARVVLSIAVPGRATWMIAKTRAPVVTAMEDHISRPWSSRIRIVSRTTAAMTTRHHGADEAVPDRSSSQRLHRALDCPYGLACRSEGVEEPVALVIHFIAGASTKCGAHHLRMLGQSFSIPLLAELMKQARRALDVREHQGDDAGWLLHHCPSQLSRSEPRKPKLCQSSRIRVGHGAALPGKIVSGCG